MMEFISWLSAIVCFALLLSPTATSTVYFLASVGFVFSAVGLIGRYLEVDPNE